MIYSFTFSYRFIFDNKSNEILIKHTRYGEGSPVYLCKLKEGESQNFISEEPHV